MDVFEKWHDRVSGVGPDRHVQVNNGKASALHGVGGVLLQSRSRSFEATKNSRMWQDSHLDRHGGVLETERVNQATREEVQWCGGRGRLGSRRKHMDADGAKAVSLLTRAMRIHRTTCLVWSCERLSHEEIRCSLCS